MIPSARFEFRRGSWTARPAMRGSQCGARWFCFLRFKPLASAATFTVTNTNDSGAGSLRAGDHRREHRRRRRHDRVQRLRRRMRRLGTLHDRADLTAAKSGRRGARRRLHATRRVAKHERHRRHQCGAQGRRRASTSRARRPSTSAARADRPGPRRQRGLLLYVFVVRHERHGAGCFVGTNAAGSVAVPNTRGVYSNGPGPTVGGPSPADRNLISGNSAQNVWFENAIDGTIQGNLIGTDASGAA